MGTDEPCDSEAVIEAAYDDLNRRFPIPFVDDLSGKPLDRKLVDRFAELCRGRRVCDVGCGTGKIARYLHDRGIEVCGVDISEAALAQARQLHPEIPFVRMSIRHLDLADESLGGLASWFSIVHIPRTEVSGVFAELNRVLEPGGYLVLATDEGEGDVTWEQAKGAPVDVWSTRYSRQEIETALADNGFDVIELFERGPYATEYDVQRIFVLAIKR